MNKFETSLLAGASLLAISCGESFAQQALPVTYTATVNPAVSLFAASNGTTACNTTAQTSVQDAVTMTPGSNQFVYITGVYVDIVSANVTGSTSVATASFSNMTNSPVYSLATITATAGANGSFRQIAEVYNPPLRSQAAGTAVAWTPSATLGNSVIVCPRIAAYFAQ
jgi:hypothetical protein